MRAINIKSDFIKFLPNSRNFINTPGICSSTFKVPKVQGLVQAGPRSNPVPFRSLNSHLVVCEMHRVFPLPIGRFVILVKSLYLLYVVFSQKILFASDSPFKNITETESESLYLFYYKTENHIPRNTGIFI